MVYPEKTGPARGHFFEKEEMKRPCWNCDHESDDLYNCSNCDKLQEFLNNTDYFTLFGLGYTLSIDLDALEKQYYILSKKFHPDYYQKASQEEQAISLENTAHLTKAYRTLKDTKERVAYLCNLVEEGNNVTSEAPPTELFEEILGIQERLEAVQETTPGDDTKEVLLQELKTDLEAMQQYQKGKDEGLLTLSSEWDNLESNRKDHSFSDKQKNRLNEMKKLLSHNAYLSRIVQEIRNALDKEN